MCKFRRGSDGAERIAPRHSHGRACGVKFPAALERHRDHHPPQWLALVAAHDWDCHGAKRAGLTTGWVSRKSGGFGAPFEPPDVVGEDLTEVAAKLLALAP